MEAGGRRSEVCRGVAMTVLKSATKRKMKGNELIQEVWKQTEILTGKNMIMKGENEMGEEERKERTTQEEECRAIRRKFRFVAKYVHPDTIGGDDATSQALRRSAEAAFKLLNDALSVALEEMENNNTNHVRYHQHHQHHQHHHHQHQHQHQAQQQRPGWSDNVVRSARAKWGNSASTSTSAPPGRMTTNHSRQVHRNVTTAAGINVAGIDVNTNTMDDKNEKYIYNNNSKAADFVDLNEFVFNSGNGMTTASRMNDDDMRDALNRGDGDKENRCDDHDDTHVSVFTSSSSSELDSQSRGGEDDDDDVHDNESGEGTHVTDSSKRAQEAPMMQRDVRSVWKASRKPQQMRRAPTPSSSHAATGRRRGSKRWHRRKSKTKATTTTTTATTAAAGAGATTTMTSGKADGHASGAVGPDDDDDDDDFGDTWAQEEKRKRKEKEELGIFYDRPTTYEELYGLADERDGNFCPKRAKKQGTLNAFLFNSHP